MMFMFNGMYDRVAKVVEFVINYFHLLLGPRSLQKLVFTKSIIFVHVILQDDDVYVQCTNKVHSHIMILKFHSGSQQRLDQRFYVLLTLGGFTKFGIKVL